MGWPRRAGLRLVLLCLPTLAIAAAGCGGEATSTSGGTPAVSAGGDLVIAHSQDQKSLDPARVADPYDLAVTNHIYDRLFALSDDGRSIVPSLAKSARTSRDGKRLTVTLRDGVKFSNGRPLTSADVKYSLDRSRKADGGFSFLLGAIESISAPDPSTVVIETAEPSAPLKAALTAWVASIVPDRLGGKSERAFFRAPIGSGPFELDGWTRGVSLKLTRNDGYWQQGKPLLDSVTWTVVPDANTRVAQVRGGRADVANYVPPSQLQALAAGPVTAKGFPGFTSTFLIFNQKVEPFADVHVRRAMAQAIDKVGLTKATFHGAGEPACSMVPPTMLFASEDVRCLRFDPAAAKDELARSSAPNGFSTTLTIDNQPESVAIAQVVEQQLAKLGITLRIKQVDSAQLYDVFGDGAYEAGLAVWQSDIPDPDEQLSYMLDPAGGGNAYYTGYDDPTVNGLIAKGRSTLDESRRAQIYDRIQDIAARDVPQIPLLHSANVYAWSTKVSGWSVNPMNQPDLVNVGKAQG